MKLFTKEQYEKLLRNGKDQETDHAPIVKLFTPDAGCTWLISWLNPDDPDIAFGLADLGVGCPEMGYIYLPEISELLGNYRLPVERDLFFKGEFNLSVYARLAVRAGCISENRNDLFQMDILMQSEGKK